MSEESDNTHVQIVHSAGLTRVLYAPSAARVDRLFTAGDESVVRILPTDPTSQQEARLIEDAAEPITWLDADASRLISSSTDGCVRMYSHRNSIGEQGEGSKATEMEAMITRTSLPARCVALERAVKGSNAPRVAVCSDQLIVKVVDVGDTTRANILTGHTKAVRAAAWSPTAPILVTVGCEGSIRIWDLAESEAKCIKVLDDVVASSRPDDEASVCPVWHPNGTYFVVPAKSHELVMFSSANWMRAGSFSGAVTSAIPTPTGYSSFLAFCPNGRYLCSATSDSQVTIWQTSTHEAIRYRTAEGLVTGISWHPSADALAWTDCNGSLVRWKDVIGSKQPSPFESIAHNIDAANTGFDDDIDDLFGGTGLDDDIDMDELNDDLLNDRATSRELDDFIVDDDGGAKDYIGKRKARHVDSSRSRSKYPDGGPSSRYAYTPPSTQGQPALQPGSTPLLNGRRFLAYTMFGTLLSIDADTNRVVQFDSFDVSSRRNFRLTDYFGYTMGALGGAGVLLACPPSKDTSEAATSTQHGSVFFKPFEAAGYIGGQSSEWSIQLPTDEEPVAVALSTAPARRDDADDNFAGNVAHSARQAGSVAALVATSTGYVRLFSSSGMQVYVWALGQPVVALAAGAHMGLIVHRVAGGALEGYQNLHFVLFDLHTLGIRAEGPMPLSKDVTLRWTGFNDADVPAMYDSRGVLYTIDRPYGTQARWVPTLDTKTLGGIASASLTYWPVGLTSSRLACLILRGTPHPDAASTARPLVQELELQMPLCGRSDAVGGEAGVLTGAAALEEKRLRLSLLASTLRESTTYADSVAASGSRAEAAAAATDSDKALLQLIQLACKSDKHARALDAAALLSQPHMLEAALQIAAFFHLPSLGERMEGLREQIERRKDEEDEARVEEWGAPPQSMASSILVPSTQQTDLRVHQARRALGEDFAPRAGPPRRSTGLAMLESPSPAPMGAPRPPQQQPPKPVWPDASALSSIPPVTADDQSNEGDEDGHQVEKKRKAEDHDGSTDAQSNKAGGGNPFAKRANPFARTMSKQASRAGSSTSLDGEMAAEGKKRDRSMHKSTSFFDRVEAVNNTGSTSTKPKDKKQGTLFGLPLGSDKAKAKNGRPSKKKEAEQGDADNGENGDEARHSNKAQPALQLPKNTSGIGLAPASTPAFADTQMEYDLDAAGGALSTESQIEEEESMRRTLEVASRKEARGPVLEETQLNESMDSQSQVDTQGDMKRLSRQIQET